MNLDAFICYVTALTLWLDIVISPSISGAEETPHGQRKYYLFHGKSLRCNKMDH